jgi:Gamma-glutamyl cyclotransferase, AIG2-like
MRLFFYGSLLDPAIRRRVLGAAAQRLAAEPATLDGWRRWRRRDLPWWMVRRCPGARVEGVLVGPVGAPSLRLLRRYEGPLYRTRAVFVRRRDGRRLRALVFVAAG